MIIGYFHIIGIAISEAKAYTPLVIDRNGVLSLAVTL